MAASCVNLTTLLEAASVDAAALGLTSIGVIVGMLFEQVVGLGTAETGSCVAEAADIDAFVTGTAKTDAVLAGPAEVCTGKVKRLRWMHYQD